MIFLSQRHFKKKILVSKETVVLRWWELETEIDFIKRVDKGRSSDEGLTLETSAFQIFHGGYSTFINSFDKRNYCTLKSTHITIAKRRA